MQTEGTETLNRRFVLAAVVDLFFPWVGTTLTRKPPAGRWGMIFWMMLQVSLVLWVLTNAVELPQAAAIQVVAWVVAQISIQSKSLEAWRAARSLAVQQPAGRLERYISIALVLAVYVVTPTVFVTRMAGNLDTVRISDLAMFPTVLQDETILVLKSRSGIDAGRLVVFDAPGGPQIGRVVAVGGEHVEVSEGLVTIDRQPSTVSRREAIDFPHIRLNARESLEGAGLQYFLEKHKSAGYETPAFLRTGVYTVSSGVDVPEGSVYVLSDNRTSDRAVDSRHIGPVAIKDIHGIPMFVIWSGGGGLLGRLERIGAWTR